MPGSSPDRARRRLAGWARGADGSTSPIRIGRSRRIGPSMPRGCTRRTTGGGRMRKDPACRGSLPRAGGHRRRLPGGGCTSCPCVILYSSRPYAPVQFSFPALSAPPPAPSRPLSSPLSPPASPGPGLHRDAGARHHARSGVDDRPDGLRVHGLSAGVCAVRDSDGLVGRSQGHARGAVADRAVVVRLSRQPRGRRSATPSCSPSAFCSACGEAGAWPCVARTFSRWIPRRERGTVQGIFFAGAHLVGGSDAGAGALAAAVHVVAADLRLLRRGRPRVGRGLAHVVPQRSRRSTQPVNAAELQTIVADRPPDSGHPRGEYWRGWPPTGT